MYSSRTSTQLTTPPERQKKAGWMHDFCDLARQEENIIPSSARINMLLGAGLGSTIFS